MPFRPNILLSYSSRSSKGGGVGAGLTKAYNVAIPRYPKSHKNIKKTALWNFIQIFDPITSPNRHFTMSLKIDNLW